MEKNSRSISRGTMAGALLCPSCCIEYVQVEFDLEIDGAILHNVKALKCPECEEELFTLQQQEVIKKKIEESTKH